MPKAPSTSVSKSKKSGNDKENKTKREPNVYNKFVSAQLPIYKAANPGVDSKTAFKEIAVMWRDSEENPNRGKPVKSKKKKVADALPASSSSAPSSSQPSSAVPSSDI
ncbi:hypothetical protein BDZ89DRAFT_1056730 [Hymenopellis radicata]|nr:hypothetical protein BDZ89DRAFT_1058794 [Hymenopellis radicata]KAF9052370.1 hypothetical protein BDZ89DRAFT_1056730 [Hymenopellis radicata]